MNQLLIGIAKRITFKAIKINSEDYNIKVSLDFIGKTNYIVISLCDKYFFNKMYYFCNDDLNNNRHIKEFKKVLRKIRKREI